VLDEQGRPIFSEVTTNSVWRVENDHSVTRLVAGRHSHDLFRDRQGALYGEHVTYDAARDRWLRSLWRLEPSGRLETPVDPAAETVRAQQMSEDLAAVNARVWGPDGALYVTDGPAVRRVGAESEVTTLGGDPLAGAPHGEHPRLLGLAVSRAGSVLVADADHGLVREITRSGAVLDRWESGRLWSPAGIAVDDGDGSVYLLESRPENVLMLLEKVGPWARVRKVDQDGRTTVVAVVGSWRKAEAVGLIVLLAGGALVRLRRRATP
jgi:hypothetical protein